MELTFPGFTGQTARGTIVDIGATATVKENQITYPVRIDVAAPPAQLKFGMSAQASIPLAEAKDVLVAPRRAIRTVGGQTVVDKLAGDGQVQDVPVKVGRTFGTQVELLDGLKEGDVVAVYEGITAGARRP